MEKEELQNQLRGMGFSDPFPQYTMSKNIQLKTGEIISLQVWACGHPNINDHPKAQCPYIYFGTPKSVSYKYPYELLGIDYDGYYTGITKDGGPRPTSIYPKINTIKDVEDVCFKLTGKSIYDIDIKESVEERKEAEVFWSKLNEFSENRVSQKAVPKKRKWYQFI